jgi:HEPN domain-containing protein
MNSLFSENTWPAISQVSRLIVSALSPEKIFLLSVIHHKEEVRSIFIDDMQEEYLIEALNILVLTGESEKKSNEELQDMIEHRLGIHIPVTAFVLKAGQFNEWLKKDHPFACKVIHKAKLYFDANNIPLVIPSGYNELAAKDFLMKESEQKTNKAIEFLAGAELFIVRKQFNLAAFHLHQAAEQIYAGIIRFTTGLQVQTHNLDKLYRYSKYLLPGLKDLFPRDTEAERKLFQGLQKAYLGARYDAEYSIKYPGVSLLFERIKKLLILCQGMQRSKITIA